MASFWQTLFAFFFRNSTPEAARKRALKAIVRQIRLTKNSKFYQPKTGELSPACGNFFYRIYKTVSPARITMPSIIKSAALRYSIIEYYLGKEILKKFDAFSPESIAERAKNINSNNASNNPKHLAEEVRQEFDSLSSAIDAAVREQIDSCYMLILLLDQFVSFDFYALLKKFGLSAREHDFTVIPRFTNCNAYPVINMIQDFVDYIALTDPSQDWKTAFIFLKNPKTGNPLMPEEQWKDMLFQFQEILNSRIFQLIIQHVTGNIEWKINPQIPDGHIFSDWLEIKRQTIEDAIDKIAASRQISEINERGQAIFGNMAINSLKFYNDKTAAMFAAKSFKGFLHVNGLNYLMTFLRHIFEKEMQEFGDLLIVRAQWGSISVSASFSAGWNNMRDLVKELENFDNSLDSGNKKNLRLFIALERADRDRSQNRIITELLSAIDMEAMEILIHAINYLTNIAKIVESIKNDCLKTPHLLILNWRELETAAGQNMMAWLKRISIRLEKFIELSRLFI
jgi:hypothetical protein